MRGMRRTGAGREEGRVWREEGDKMVGWGCVDGDGV